MQIHHAKPPPEHPHKEKKRQTWATFEMGLMGVKYICLSVWLTDCRTAWLFFFFFGWLPKVRKPPQLGMLFFHTHLFFWVVRALNSCVFHCFWRFLCVSFLSMVVEYWRWNGIPATTKKRTKWIVNHNSSAVWITRRRSVGFWGFTTMVVVTVEWVHIWYRGKSGIVDKWPIANREQQINAYKGSTPKLNVLEWKTR